VVWWMWFGYAIRRIAGYQARVPEVCGDQARGTRLFLPHPMPPGIGYRFLAFVVSFTPYAIGHMVVRIGQRLER